MALGLPTDQRGQIMALLILVALAGGYFFWTKVHQPQSAQIAAETQQADSLEKIVEAAKRDLASGSIEDLRRRVEEYNGSLELMRRLVPDRSEEHTSELQSLAYLVCRLLLEKKKTKNQTEYRRRVQDTYCIERRG